jgi:hypothetical protein
MTTSHWLALEGYRLVRDVIVAYIAGGSRLRSRSFMRFS